MFCVFVYLRKSADARAGSLCRLFVPTPGAQRKAGSWMMMKKDRVITDADPGRGGTEQNRKEGGCGSLRAFSGRIRQPVRSDCEWINWHNPLTQHAAP